MKKDFKKNPALQFITEATEEAGKVEAEEAGKTDTPPKGYKLIYVETKTQRLQLVLQPSLYKELKARAKQENLSVNEYVTRILKKEMRGEL